MQKKSMSKNSMSKLVKLTQLAVLTAIIIVMSVTGLGYLQVGMLSIAIVIIPVVIGAVVFGPGAGAYLGLVFGITSFAQCFTKDVFGMALLGISPIKTFLMCVPTRVLAGFLCGLIFKAISGGFKREGKNKVSEGFAYPLAAISGPVFNTSFFILTLLLFFGKTKEVTDLIHVSKDAFVSILTSVLRFSEKIFGDLDNIILAVESIQPDNLFMVVLFLVGFNFIVEIFACFIIGSAVSKAINVANKKMKI